jgi:sec-independent protein translocase protein TatA
MRIGPLGIWELLIILVVVLLIFGPRRLPDMAKGIGQSVREFRKGIRTMQSDLSTDEESDQKDGVSQSDTTKADKS